ncbi:MAG TPA: proprotein convertase P-domain-containing protein, partial [Kofleriaceae bacterium]
PVELAGDRLALGVNDAPQNVPDNGTAATTMTVTGYTGTTGAAELVDSIEITYEIDAPHRDQLTVELEAPTTQAGPGARVAISETSGRDLSGSDRLVQSTISSSSMLLGGPASGDWKLHVTDAPGGPGNASVLRSARLALHTRGGPDKLARMASWTSAVIDAQTPVFVVDGVTWNERTVSGVNKVAVRVRTCTQADCNGVDWLDPKPKGAAFNVSRGRYLQLRVDMTSDGTHEPELSGLAIAFRRDP